MISTMRSRGQRDNEVFADADAHIDGSWPWIPTTSEAYPHLNDGMSVAVQGEAPSSMPSPLPKNRRLTTLRARVSRSRANKGASR
jgi:hypothetical protein